MSADRVALRGRLVDARGFPVAGTAQLLVPGAVAASVALDAAGGFAVEMARPAAGRVTVADPVGREYAIDMSSAAPTVQSSVPDGRLLLDYGGDPDMQGQTAESMAAAARADAVAAQQVATAAQASANAVTATLALAMTTMQAALAAAQAAQSRKVALVLGRAAVPNLAVGVEKQVAVTWSPALPVAPSSTLLLLEPTGSVLGQVTASVKADSVTAVGVTVLLRAPLAVALGAGSVVVVGAYLT